MFLRKDVQVRSPRTQTAANKSLTRKLRGGGEKDVQLSNVYLESLNANVSV